MSNLLTWCPNCKQNVNPQKDKSNRGGIFGVLLVLGLLLLFVGFIPGIIMLVFAFIYLVVGFLFEVASLATPAHCPICKATNLAKGNP